MACRLGYGGPYCGVIACKEKFLRQMPGRLVGETKDMNGKRGFVLTLSTREQHIRREKATSNICTNQSLVAMMVTVFLTVYGKGSEGAWRSRIWRRRTMRRQVLGKSGKVLFGGAPRFNEFVLDLGKDAEKVNAALLEKKIIGGLPLAKWYPELGRGREFVVRDGVDDEGADRCGCGGACEARLAMDVSAIIGEELKAVEFVEDFLQLRFEAPLLTLYAWPHVLLTDFSVAFRRAGVSECTVRADWREGCAGFA